MNGDDESICLRDQRPLRDTQEKRKSELKSKQDRLNQCLKEIEQRKAGSLAWNALKAQKEVFEQSYAQITAQISQNLSEIAKLESTRDDLVDGKNSNPGAKAAAAELQKSIVNQIGMPRPPTPASGGLIKADYWTSV